jgi:hypothetical protein
MVCSDASCHIRDGDGEYGIPSPYFGLLEDQIQEKNTWRSEESEKSNRCLFRGLVAPLKCLIPFVDVTLMNVAMNVAVPAKAGARPNTGTCTG